MPDADESNALERPAWACAVCLPPRGNRAWTPADPRHVTCSNCYTRLRDRLKEVAARFLQLDPRPGANDEYGTRGVPGFVSKPPLNVEIVCMRDPRSSTVARVWVADDGRVHREEERPPKSVWSELSTMAWAVAEHRDITPPADGDDVYALIRFLDVNMDYITRHAELTIDLGGTLRELLFQLKPLTGDARKWIGFCPNTIDMGDTSRVCARPLYAPLPGSGSGVIRCLACGREWYENEWLHLGDLLAEVD